MGNTQYLKIKVPADPIKYSVFKFKNCLLTNSKKRLNNYFIFSRTIPNNNRNFQGDSDAPPRHQNQWNRDDWTGGSRSDQWNGSNPDDDYTSSQDDRHFEGFDDRQYSQQGGMVSKMIKSLFGLLLKYTSLCRDLKY